MANLKYARVERERRWLLGSVPDLLDGAQTRAIVDRYVHGTRLRLRQVTGPDGSVTRKLGHKVRLGDGAEAVACTSMYLDDAEWKVLARLPADVLVKSRTLVPYDGSTIALDVFDSGLVLAELDTGDGPARELPAAWVVVREVTAEEEFTGASLARSTS